MTETTSQTQHVGSRVRRCLALLGLGALVAPVVAIPAVGIAEPAHAEVWRESQFWLEDYGVPEAWETTMGEGITVAVIDTGVDAEHPTLEDAVVGGADFSGGGDGSGEPVEQMVTEHGTLVASLIAGRGVEVEETEQDLTEEAFDEMTEEEWDAWFFENIIADLVDTYGDDWEDEVDMDLLEEFYETRRFPADLEEEVDDEDEDDDDEDSDLPTADEDLMGGVVGIAPESDIISASLVLEDPNQYGPGTEEQIADAVIWAVDEGADIINLSIGSGVQEWPEAWDEAFLHAEENDVLVIAAAGNRASGHFSVGAPATIPGVLTVAGVDENRNISEDASSQGIAIDIAAASEPLVGAMPGGGNAIWEGTSGAAPIVAGAAALVMAAHPDLSAVEVKHRLLTTADEEGSGAGDPEYGHGVLNVAEAVNGDVPEFNADDYPTLEEWVRVSRRAESDGNNEHVDIPEEGGVVAGPEGDPREVPQASESSTVQDWAGPAAVLGGGALVVILLGVGTTYIVTRMLRNR